MSRAKRPAVHITVDSDLSSPPNSPRLVPIKARMKNRNAHPSTSNNVRALPLQPSVIANTPKKRPHEGDDKKDAPKPKKTRKNDDKPLEPVSLSYPQAKPFLALPAYLFHIVAYRSQTRCSSQARSHSPGIVQTTTVPLASFEPLDPRLARRLFLLNPK